MTDIIRVDYARNKDEVMIYIWLNIRNKQQIKTKIICISTDEALNIINYNEKFELKDQQYYIIPRTIKNFEKTICKFLIAVFAADLISKEKYIEFCKKRLEVYRNIYYNENRICRQFFSNYFPDNKCEGYDTFSDVLKNNIDEINCKLSPHYRRIEPKFIGCYTDEYDRVRPITSRVSYEQYYDKIEQLWSALELALEGKLKDLKKVEEQM